MQTDRLRELRDIAIVAEQELLDALRSRRALVFLLLFTGGAVGGTLLFVELLASLEAGLASTLGAAAPLQPGAMTSELLRSEDALRMATGVVNDRALAIELLRLPPLALFYGWLGLTFVPVLVMLTSAESIASELATGSIRFSLLRTTRLAWGVGKLLGQSLLLAVNLLIGALAVWVTGFFALDAVTIAETGMWLALLSLRTWFYGVAFVGLALGLSHLTRSVPLARGLGLLSLALCSLLSGLSDGALARRHVPVIGPSLAKLLPQAHELGLWQPELSARLPSLIMLLSLSVLYFSAGYLFRARRDA